MLASKNTPGVPSKYEWVQDTYEQFMLCKHGEPRLLMRAFAVPQHPP
jgi:hypothetical protein